MERKEKPRRARSRAIVIAGLAACAILAIVVWQAWSTRAVRDQQVPPPREGAAPVTVDQGEEARIVAFCGDCHALPRPGSFPRDAWYEKVRRGYHFYAQSGRNDLDPPPVHSTVAYYRSRAPEQLVFPQPKEAESEFRATFTVQRLPLEQPANVPPGIAHLRWARLDPDAKSVLLACDMRDGTIAAVDLNDRRPRRRILARLNNPCHVEPCDLDADGAIDLVIADLGSFLPDDHDRGRVVWLRGRKAEHSFEQVVVASGLGRVADARPADFDGDGDLDLIVAVFGLHRTGDILLLRNVADPGKEPRFEPEELDPRPGTIHVPVGDLNRDGLPDFVALVSQEYEQVDAFFGQGDGRFHLHNLWAGPDLAFGSTGIELVDLDQDGDEDVLYTNGDAFDNNYVNPSHGVQWLENLDGLEFAYHRLADMPGVHRALAGDLDLDGDLDVITSSFLPRHVLPAGLEPARLPSILCLEQTSPGVFVRHTLQTGLPYHAALELADFDNDGDLDFAVGSHLTDVQATSHWLAVWWNEGIQGDEHP